MNTANFTNISSLQSLASFTNANSGDLLFNGAMVVFFVIIVLFLNRNQLSFENNITVAAWLMFLVSTFLWFSHLVVTFIPLIFLLISAIGTFYLYSSR